MGCSASRPNTLLSKNSNCTEEDPFYSSPSNSTEKPISSKCSTPTKTPHRRALSLHTPLVHHPPAKKGDSHHLVSLTSTTYGSLRLTTSSPAEKDPHDEPQGDPPADSPSPSPDSVINTWELMDGLEDEDDVEEEEKEEEEMELGFVKVKSFDQRLLLSDVSSKVPSIPTLFHHLGPDGCLKKLDGSVFSVKSRPLWKLLSEESLLSSMDPNVASSYRRALSSRQFGCDKERRNVISLGSSPLINSLSPRKDKDGIFLPGTEDKIVLFFTSLRGIRKTYEDCCLVRNIIRGFRVPVDERDISMDSALRKELQGVLKGKAFRLPQLFVRGNYIGGVEEVRQLNDDGELATLFKGFPVRDPSLVCGGCGDVRFLPCPNCSGSRRVFDEELEQLERCLHCNENGLIRCPGCCS